MPVGDDRYAITADRVREVVTDPRSTVVPGMPASVIGLVNVRGEVVPLLDTGAILGLEVVGSAAFAVVVHSSEGPAALTVTELPDVIALDDLLGPSDMVGSADRYRYDSRLVVLLDVDVLLAIARGESPTVAVGGS